MAFLKFMDNVMSRKSLVLFGLALIALALYMAEIKMGAYALFAVAFAVELWFWLKLFKQRKNHNSKSE